MKDEQGQWPRSGDIVYLEPVWAEEYEDGEPLTLAHLESAVAVVADQSGALWYTFLAECQPQEISVHYRDSAGKEHSSRSRHVIMAPLHGTCPYRTQAEAIRARIAAIKGYRDEYEHLSRRLEELAREAEARREPS